MGITISVGYSTESKTFNGKFLKKKREKCCCYFTDVFGADVWISLMTPQGVKGY